MWSPFGSKFDLGSQINKSVGGKKAGPAPPDYMGLAKQMGENEQQNIAAQTWANRANQSNPWGDVNWTAEESIDPATGQKVTKWNQKTTLDPEAQRALDAQQGLQAGRSELAGSMFDRVAADLSQGPDYSSLAPWQSGAQAGNLQAITNPFGFGGAPTTGANSQFFDTSRSQVPTLNTNLGQGAGQGIQRGLDFGG